MILIIVVTLLILGIAFFQVTQGFYSALIMAILTAVCAVLAFAFYEPLAAALRDTLGAPAEGVSLLALFALPLLGLRFAADKFLGANAVASVWLDRLAGGALGLFVGTVAVGVTLVALQMLPVPASFMGYTAYNESLQRQDRVAPFYPDEFVVGMVDTLSAGSFSGDQRFTDVHHDLLRELFAARVQMEQTVKDQKDRVGRTDADVNSLVVLGAYDISDANWVQDIPADPLYPDATKVIAIRVAVAPSAADGKWFRLPGPHFELVTDKQTGHYPLAYLTAWEEMRDVKNTTTRPGGVNWRPITPPGKGAEAAQLTRLAVQRESKGKLILDWVFRVGLDEKPDYIVFRRSARQAVPEITRGLPSEAEALSRLVEKKK